MTVNEAIVKLSSSNYLVNNPLPKGWSIEVCGGKGNSKEKILASFKANNELQNKYGPFKTGHTAAKNSQALLLSGNSSRSAIENGDVTSQPPISFQAVTWITPSIPANGQGVYPHNAAYMINNFRTDGTNDKNFLQSGQAYVFNGTVLNGWWAPFRPTFTPFNFTSNSGDWVKFQELYTPGLNWVTTGEDDTQGTFSMTIFDTTQIDGTHVYQQVFLDTSIFFENWFNSTDWQSNWTTPLTAYYALDGTLNNQHNWGTGSVHIFDGYGNEISNVLPCPPVYPPGTKIITGDLHGGTCAYWNLLYIPLGQ